MVLYSRHPPVRGRFGTGTDAWHSGYGREGVREVRRGGRGRRGRGRGQRRRQRRAQWRQRAAQPAAQRAH